MLSHVHAPITEFDIKTADHDNAPVKCDVFRD